MLVLLLNWVTPQNKINVLRKFGMPWGERTTVAALFSGRRYAWGFV